MAEFISRSSKTTNENSDLRSSKANRIGKQLFSSGRTANLSSTQKETHLQGPVSEAATDDNTRETTKGHSLKELLAMVGLDGHYKNKLTLSTVLEINAKTVSDEPLETMQSLPGEYLKRLMMVNVKARGVTCMSIGQEDDLYDDLDNLENDTDNTINPTDLVTALFLCSDGFLQQELVLKMSMCQFAVPLLLPNCDTEQSTLMLWALRDIVKKFRPSASKSLIEQTVVNADIPMVSFVRLGKRGEGSLSKSQILNQLLSNPQQYHDTFVHREMECGDVPRKISNGLVEMSWYLPCGNTHIDMFDSPVAVANLRGDVRTFDQQLSFLCQTSAAVYMFCDDVPVEADLDILRKNRNRNTEDQLYLIVNSKIKTFKNIVDKFIKGGSIKMQNVIVKKKQNDAEFVKKLQLCVGTAITKNKSRTLTVEDMAVVARRCGIVVDEDNEDCQTAKKMADAITSSITNTLKFKNKQLPLQGKIWRELSQLEKERCRLRKLGENEIEHYQSYLKEQEKELRKEQQTIDMSGAMMNFVCGINTSEMQRSYFLKWLRIGLDNLSRQSMSGLRDKYKEICQKTPQDKTAIANLDRQISDCSLGVEHFLRELGQLYGSVCSLPEDNLRWKQMEQLPGLCAQMLLDGFPIELVDGDASNIPLNWISKVLTCLHGLVKSESKIKVVTVLGVQSTGKSTLLNTMFGVRFAVSSGRCTRGAFMLLIKANNDIKEELKCDYIMVIDTEGLKSPELAQLDDSHEHDNELATLVIGLSDVTIINIAMENSTEMKDILQIVVHAFIRMEDMGKKPICHFVHQNVSDMSAHDNNMRDRNKLLDQLDEMTLAAAKMEKKKNITKFTDVMQYNPETSSCYIPGLWRGTPPMAPVNAGYSEAVYDFKNSLMQDFQKCKSNCNLLDFKSWTENLWQSVKYEKFIFSFRNSLVADAYARLCTAYSTWEWSFQKEMYDCMVTAENKISNFNMTDSKSSIKNLLSVLKHEASNELTKGENAIQENLKKYFGKQDGHVSLVEKYKADFVNSAKTLRRETENSMMNKLQEAFEIKNGMAVVDNIKGSQARIMEEKVLDLLKNCKQKTSPLSDRDLMTEFERMWKKSLAEINFKGLPKRDVATDAFNSLRANLTTKGGQATQMLHRNNLVNCGKKPFVLDLGSSFLKQVGSVIKHGDKNYHQKKTQELCNNIIQDCKDIIKQKVEGGGDYHDTYIKELLEIIDGKMDNLTDEWEVSLKQHICGIAVERFQKMHDDFITLNDPRNCLEESKSKYCADFIDLFNERDQCQRKAKEFTEQCLRPAVLDYVTKRIGPVIMDEMKSGEGSLQYSTRGAFQFKVLEQLIIDSDYDKYNQYLNHYERFVKVLLFDNISEEMSQNSTLENLEEALFSEILKKINSVISTLTKTRAMTNDIKTFIDQFSSSLSGELVMSKGDLDSITRLNTANTERFAEYLIESVNEMKQSLATKYDKDPDVRKRLKNLPFKPQDQMFTKLFGCGKQCPFCGTPCEAGGEEHTTHFSSMHRSQGLVGMRYKISKELTISICSSDVLGESTFTMHALTGETGHPYKDYKKHFPDWQIDGDTSIEATCYWKYVMATFNERIAEDAKSYPADVPADWKELTKDDAMKSLKKLFGMNLSVEDYCFHE